MADKNLEFFSSARLAVVEEMSVESRLRGITVVAERRKKTFKRHRAEKADYRAREIVAAVKLRPKILVAASRRASGLWCPADNVGLMQPACCRERKEYESFSQRKTAYERRPEGVKCVTARGKRIFMRTGRDWIGWTMIVGAADEKGGTSARCEKGRRL